MKDKDLPWNIFMWIILLDMLMSLDVWFFWGVNRVIFSIVASVYCFLYSITNQRIFSSLNNKLLIGYLFLFLAYCLSRSTMNLFGWIGSLIQFVPPFFVVLLTKERAQVFFRFFKNCLSYLLCLSLFCWVLFLLGLPLPHTQISFGEYEGFARYYYDNYYLFLLNRDSYRDLILPRFSSVFTEPGFLGCLLAVLLFSEGFVLKNNRHNIVFLVSLFFTFSLAGWLIGLIGFMFNRLKPSVQSFFIIGCSIIAFFLLYSFASSYKGGNNVLYNYFFSRLEYDNTRKTIQGYNRNAAAVDDYFDVFIRSDYLWFGEGVESGNVDLNNSVDWKAFMIKYGLLSSLLVLLWYIWPFLSTRYKKFHLLGVTLVFLLIAMQTSYGIFSCMYISLFALSVKGVGNTVSA